MAKTQATDNSNDDIETAWFALSGPYDDVILSTRVRLARNLADFPFPSKMQPDDFYQIESLVYDAFSQDEDFRFMKIEDLSEPGIEILKDKNILENTKCSAVLVNMLDESTSCLVNETDHVKISSFVSGLDCEKAMSKAYKIDEMLQNKLQFAASFDFGYLTSRIKDCGTGMKISIRIFIPSIILSGQFDSIVSLVKEKKLLIAPVFKNNEIADFSNCIFDITTGSSADGTEFDQMAVIQAAGMLILKTERKIRQEFADNNPTVVLNFFKQSYARAVSSLLLSYEEGVSVVSAMKWGIQLQLASGITENELNALFYRTKFGHLKYLCDNFTFSFEDDIKTSETLQLKRLRTIVIQHAFEGIVNEKPVS